MFKIIAAVVVIILIVMVAPFLTIWSLNTLFPTLAIPYTLETWVASVILFGLTRTTVTKAK